MNALTTKQKKYLRALAHDLKPIVYIGQQGLSDAVVKDAERALSDHELIKVRFIDHKEEKKELAEKIAAHTNAFKINEDVVIPLDQLAIYTQGIEQMNIEQSIKNKLQMLKTLGEFFDPSSSKVNASKALSNRASSCKSTNFMVVAAPCFVG